jgi:hypothetical protein
MDVDAIQTERTVLAPLNNKNNMYANAEKHVNAQHQATNASVEEMR